MDTEELCKACEQLAERWREASSKIVELAEALHKAFEKCGDDVGNEKTFPKRIRTKRVEAHYCKKYDYIPVARKNLPYQRRNY